jgi:hypothetical protein
MQQNSPEKAAEIYRTLVAVDPSSPDYRWSLAEVLAQTQGVGRRRRDYARQHRHACDRVAFLAQHRDKAVEAELAAAIAAPETSAYGRLSRSRNS